MPDSTSFLGGFFFAALAKEKCRIFSRGANGGGDRSESNNVITFVGVASVT
jgi:hypothetical protein